MSSRFFLALPAAVVMMAIFPVATFGTVGVGVGTGKIQIDEPLDAGGIYDLPAFVVLNTGNEPSDYEVAVEYQKDVPQIWPAREWFEFYPKTFQLEPGKTRIVQTSLRLPVITRPGEYFAYLEARPFQRDAPGQASIGIAAATKLYFAVAPANLLQGLFWRASGLYGRYNTLVNIVMTASGVILLIRFVGKRFQIHIAKR